MAKRIFDVQVQEIWNRTFTVEAENSWEASEIANNLIESGASEGNFEYSHTLDKEEWYVADISSQVEDCKYRGIETKIDNK